MPRQKSLAPEPYFTASLMLLHEMMVYIRLRTARPERFTEADAKEIHALVNALHNIPTSIREYGEWFDEARIRASLREFDIAFADRGATNTLEATFDRLLQTVQRRD